MSTVLAEITRSDRVESVHTGAIAVVDTSGNLACSAGNAEMFLYFRSSAKPFQAIPVIESGAADRFGFTPAELALCCASHNAEETHQAQVLAMLAKLGLGESALQCGAPMPSDDDAFARVQLGSTPKSPLQCDCSGKHSGMLAACLALGLPIETYLDPAHQLQLQIKDLVAEACGVSVSSLVMATDGCSLPTFGSTLHAFARSFAVLSQPKTHADALNRLRSAMIAHPENVSGQGELVANLMRLGNGDIVAKSGAEGLICIGLPKQGLGIAIRVADGSFRAHPVLAIEALRQLDAVPESVLDGLTQLHDPFIFNHNRRIVGKRQATFTLR